MCTSISDQFTISLIVNPFTFNIYVHFLINLNWPIFYSRIWDLSGTLFKTNQENINCIFGLIPLAGRSIQSGEHDSIEDARAALDLFKLVQDQLEEKQDSCFELNDGNQNVDEEKSSFFDDQFWPDDMED